MKYRATERYWTSFYIEGDTVVSLIVGTHDIYKI
jgi:hypothetical protein